MILVSDDFVNVFAVNSWKFDIEITPIACCERKFVPFLVGISRILRRCIPRESWHFRPKLLLRQIFDDLM